ncbi:zinc-dependent alcohol dehydrogenase family protein [uncultured Jatrophihabitans sp.]|uniref:zinc-dependent alcohol dehydrogenase family protein n=1 Tax=uncultured Jatrophihabitans sp. TaxID=1610747 RepID=UPI0035CA85CE
MSKVVVFDEFGGPEVLHIVGESEPEPAEHEVRVRLEAFAVNPLDAMMRSGRSPAPVPLPHARLGIEGTGIVDAVGAEVSTLRVGDAVIVAALPDSAVRGAYAQHVTLPATAVIPRPAGLDVPHAASIWVAFATAYGSLIEMAGLRPADHVLVAGASGAVGRMAMQIANEIGAVPIAVTRSAERIDELLSAGATAVIATDAENVVDETRRLTGSEGADVVFDLISGPGQQDLLRAARPGGVLVAGGFLDPRPTPQPVDSPSTVLNYRGWDHLLDGPELTRTAAFMAAGVRLGALQPAVDTVFGFDDVVEAHRRFDQGLYAGRKIVVTT